MDAGAVLTASGVWASPVILCWMGTDSLVLPESIEYSQYYFACGFAIVLYNIFTGIIYVMGTAAASSFI